MVAPTVNTLTPNTGFSRGGTCVTIDGADFLLPSAGGTVKVYFNDVEAVEGGPVDDTTVLVLTPPGILGVVDVRVENVPDTGTTEPTTVVGGFTYQLPQLETNRDLGVSEDSVLLLVTRTLIKEFRRAVIANTHHDIHPEYVDALSASQGQEVQAVAPNLKVIGPNVSEDRFYSLNGRFNIETVPGFDVYDQPVTVRLDYDYVGVGRSKGEAFNLWSAITAYLNRSIFLEVPKDGLDPVNGVIAFELNPTFDERAKFRTTTRQGFHQFTGALHLRGVHAVANLVCPGRRVVDCVIVTEKLTIP